MYRYFTDFIHLFGQEKSFVQNVFLTNTALNRRGLHQKRVMLAHKLTQWRRFLLSSLLSKEQRNFFKENGYILIHDFLTKDNFSTLHDTISKIDNNIKICHQGDTITKRVLFTTQLYKQYPSLKILRNNIFLKQLFQYTGAAGHGPVLYGEGIHHGSNPLNHQQDPQKNLHSDTFFPTVKAWLYLEDITPEKGCFHYVPGSHKLTEKRKKWEYEMSLTAPHSSNPYTRKGSFRIDETDLSSLSLPKPKAFCVPKNTLLLADTYGFHKRGQALPQQTRLAVFMLDRANPFMPLPSWDLSFIPQLRADYIENNMIKNEKKALSSNQPPMWQSVQNMPLI